MKKVLLWFCAVQCTKNLYAVNKREKKLPKGNWQEKKRNNAHAVP